MSQELPTFNFEWAEDTSLFSEVFVKNYDLKGDIFFSLMFNTSKNCMNFIVTCHFYQKERNLEKLKSLLLT